MGVGRDPWFRDLGLVLLELVGLLDSMGVRGLLRYVRLLGLRVREGRKLLRVLELVGLLVPLGVRGLLRYVGLLDLRMWKGLELLRLLGLMEVRGLLRYLWPAGLRTLLGLWHGGPGSGGPVVPAGVRGMGKLTCGIGVLVLVR
ncbi:hypothetical protein [Streptomyces yangpuensis]|uniref:hypothetical protein n=1 Tax=Streptomyces yangpuensis TaxID=1648182 RepID=UPI0035DF3F40